MQKLQRSVGTVAHELQRVFERANEHIIHSKHILHSNHAELRHNRKFWRWSNGSQTRCGTSFALRSDEIESLNKTEVNVMKRLLIGLATLVALAFVTSDVTAQQRHGNMNAGQRGQKRMGAPTNAGSPNQAAKQMRTGSTNTGSLDLLRLREEEKLARDVYMALAKTSNLPVFLNIARSESQHMQAVERLIGRTNGNALIDIPGTFSYPDYQQLYQSLVASGSRSSVDALRVGVKIEEMDIADLNQLLTQSTNPQVQQVLGHLMRASQNHLRAFASQLPR